MSSDDKVNPVPVLICGDVQGRFRSLCKTVTKINTQKGPFEALYCVGSFFSDDSTEWELLKTQKIKVPLACYILGPCRYEHQKYFPIASGMELAPNVIYLGKKGILTTTSGLKIAYISGVEGQKETDYTFTAKDIYDLQRNFNTADLRGVDFLLTSQWPKYVTRGVPALGSFDHDKRGSELISMLAMTVRPWYHFAGQEGIFYERCPYRNPKPSPSKSSHCTRFVGLGELSSTKGIRFLYGVNHVPLTKLSDESLRMQRQNDTVSTECPYEEAAKLSHGNFSVSLQDADDSAKPSKKAGQVADFGKKSMKTPMQCWFCMCFPIEKHLLVTVGQHCYLSLAKGWLVPDNILIISNSHYKSTASLSEATLREVHDFKHALKRYFHSNDKHVVFYERNYKTPHMQVQVVPVCKSLNSDVVKAFFDAAAPIGVTLEEIPPYSVMKQVVGKKKSFFYLEVEYIDKQPRKFVYTIDGEFPILFPREVLASKDVLNVPDRTDWKNCTVSESEEKYACDEFREKFIKFHPFFK